MKNILNISISGSKLEKRGERRAFSESFSPFRAESNKFYIYRQQTNIVFILQSTMSWKIILTRKNAFFNIKVNHIVAGVSIYLVTTAGVFKYDHMWRMIDKLMCFHIYEKHIK
jgi:hypothetical protein